MLKRVTGTRDILPEEANFWQKIEAIAENLFSLYGYQEIRTPIIEDVSLFNRSLGETAEIVQKQMFLIERDKDTLVLRPEGTASVVRAYLENSLDKASDFIKLYYIGAMFRAERPQKGRLRQFHHIGCEVIGSNDPYLDAEVISLADNILKGCGISGYEIKLNSLGCLEDKKKLSSILKSGLKDKLNKLCDDCQDRYKRNVFRLLDCKNEACRAVIGQIDFKENYLCPDCASHFTKVKMSLNDLGVAYKVVPHLVRGLDYYTATVFEISHADLGSQDAIGAGGRYDHLVKELGGEETPAIGFALGVERLLLAANPKSQIPNPKFVYVITLGDAARKAGFLILDKLRKNKIIADMDYNAKSLKGQMRRANDLNAKFVVIIGDDELKKNVVMLKDMQTGEQKEAGVEELINHVTHTHLR